ncbi:SRPBCC family protein [Loktanella sp. M215]|uniref:SRPBCC family protein n=1 Tax=Loktanella sp. M215 TaxID=2675431 RepID=UPI001F198C1D|nr:SRPBCC family protein [Loktanella sp. M215]
MIDRDIRNWRDADLDPTDDRSDTGAMWWTLGVAMVVGTAGMLAIARSRRDELARFPDDAPGRTARQSYFGNFAVTGKTVTIGKPRHEVYDFYRNFGNLARFMENITSVRTVGDLCHWEIDAPGQSVEIVTRIVSDRAGEEIAWSSTEGSQIETRGKVLFRDAPGERGTEVEAIIVYDPPGRNTGSHGCQALSARAKCSGSQRP